RVAAETDLRLTLLARFLVWKPGSCRERDRADLQRLAQRLNKGGCELGSLSFLFVLEVDIHVRAARGFVSDRVCPAHNVFLRVALVAEAEVRVARRDLGGRPEVLVIGDAKREVARFQPLVDLVAEPGAVSKFERGAYADG